MIDRPCGWQMAGQKQLSGPDSECSSMPEKKHQLSVNMFDA